MPITVKIDGNLVQHRKGSFNLESRVEERSISSFIVEDITGIENFVRGMPIEIYDPDAALIYGGFIHLPWRQREGAISPNLFWNILCMGNEYLADKRLVIRAYTNQTLEYIVEAILADYLAAEGVHENAAGDIETGPVIKSAIFNYVNVAKCFDALAEVSGKIWFIDQHKHLYFTDWNTHKAPWNLDSSTYRPIKGSVHLETGNPKYRNRQYIKGGMGITSQQIEIFTGDGVTKAFTVGYPLALEPAGDTGSVSVTGRDPVLQPVGIKGIDVDKEVYWNKGDATLTFDTAPEDGETVTIVYYGQYPLIAIAQDYTEILARQAIEGGTGIIEEIATEAYHETAEAMQESAKAKILRYAQEAEKYVYQTRDSGLSPGQLQEITYSPFGFNAHEMLIESVVITAVGDEIRYDVSCITGPLMGSWAKFFADILTRQDISIRIGDSYLQVLLLQAETLELTEETKLDTDDFSDGITNRWLNAPPISAGSIYNVEHELLEMTEVTTLVENETEEYLWQ